LQAQRTRQLEMRMAAGSRWKDHGFIFTHPNGEPMAPWNLRDDFKLVLQKSGLPWRFNPYTARHTNATLLFAGGVNAKLVSEQLGHSRVGITLDTYTHPGEEMRAGLTAEIERILELGNTVATQEQGASG